jgi:hypothetical protein
MKTRKRLVSWFPLRDVMLPYFDHQPPTSVHDWYLRKYKGDHLPAELHCPAVRLVLQNTFVFYSPTFFRFKYNLEKAKSFYGYGPAATPTADLTKSTAGIKNQEFIGPGSQLVTAGVIESERADIPDLVRGIMPFHTLSKGPGEDYSAVFQLPVDLIFVTDKPLWMEVLPPYLHDEYYRINATIVPGTFDFSNWVRNTSVAFKIRDFSQPVNLRRDDPLFYVRFYSDNPYDTISLKLLDEQEAGVTYAEIIKENQANVSVKSFAPGLSWSIAQERFNGWKKSLSFYTRKSNPFRGYK